MSLLLLADSSLLPFRALVLLVSAVLAVVCVVLHYEVMSLVSKFLPHMHLRRRARIVAVILTMLLAHVIEVWIFALTYWGLLRWPQFGTLTEDVPPVFAGSLLNCVYFSVTTFTTLGFGDLRPTEGIRILTGLEALLGLSLITWSASFAFLQMQRDWAEFRRPTRE